MQRFAGEMARALARLMPDARELRPAAAGARALAWEQTALPWQARGGTLLSLGNIGPLLARRQVLVIHDAGPTATPEAYGTLFRAWYRIAQDWLTRRARIVTVSDFSRAELARRFGLDPATLPVIGEGGEHILRAPADPTALSAAGLAPGRYVLVVGSLAAHKNLAALGPTADMLADRGMTLAITGGLAASVFTGGRPLPARARYLGRVDDAGLRALYENAACFVFPSRYEGFGLPAVEAMHCGCPIVAARAASLPEVCADAALYADPADPADIAQAVAAILDNPSRAERLRAAGRARAAHHGWDKAAARLRDVILEATP